MPHEPDELTIKVARAISRAWMSNGEDWVHFVDEARAAISVCVEHFAGVAEGKTRLNANARRDRADDELAFQFEGLGSVIAAAIREAAK